MPCPCQWTFCQYNDSEWLKLYLNHVQDFLGLCILPFFELKCTKTPSNVKKNKIVLRHRCLGLFGYQESTRGGGWNDGYTFPVGVMQRQKNNRVFPLHRKMFWNTKVNKGEPHLRCFVWFRCLVFGFFNGFSMVTMVNEDAQTQLCWRKKGISPTPTKESFNLDEGRNSRLFGCLERASDMA